MTDEQRLEIARGEWTLLRKQTALARTRMLLCELRIAAKRWAKNRRGSGNL